MRILFVLEHFHPYTGGAEELFLGLARQLTQSGHQVEVVTTLFDNRLARKEVMDGVQIERIPCRNRFLFTLMSLPAVFRKARNADIVHTTSYNAALPAWIGAALQGKKTVITFHEVWGKLWFELPFLNAIQIALYFSFERFILLLPFTRFAAVSAYTHKALAEAGVSPKKLAMVYNGLDYSPFRDFKLHRPEKYTFCYFGRLGVSKGLDVLIPAFARLLNDFPHARLKLIIPRYPAHLFRETISLIEKFKIAAGTDIMHDLDRPELMRQVASSSCVAVPSYSEGFCFTAVEACALGIPVISSGRGALPETVSGKHLHLPKLNCDELYSAMLKAVEEKWEEKPLRVFELRDCVEGYLKIYKQLM